MKENKTCLVVRVLLVLILFLGVSFFAAKKTYAVEVGDTFFVVEPGAIWASQYSPCYMNEELMPEYEKAVADAMAGMNPAWSDVEKLLYIYNYIDTNSEYAYLEWDEGEEFNLGEFGIPDSRYSDAYDNLVNHKSVCTGYAAAFYDLARRAGIETYIVAGNAWGESHAWNMVVIDGKQYYIDCTEGMGTNNDFNYTYFLVSYELISKDHDISRFVSCENFDNKITIQNDTDYDDAVFREDQNWYLGHIDDSFVSYGTNKDGSLSIYKYSHDLKQKELLWQFDRASENRDDIYHPYIYKNELFLKSSSKICYYDKEKSELVTLVEASDSVFENPLLYSVFGYECSFNDDMITYKEIIRRHEGEFSYVSLEQVEKTLDISQYVGSDIELDNYYKVLYNTGEKFTVKASLKDGTNETVRWESSDPSVASVDSEGNVTTTGYGMAYIKAICKSSMKACVVIVPKLEAKEKEINVDLSTTDSLTVVLSASPAYGFPYKDLEWDISDISDILVLNQHAMSTCIVNVEWFELFEAGTTEITAYTPDGKLSTSFIVNVTGERPKESDTVVRYDEDALNGKYVPEGYKDLSGSPMVIEGKPDFTWNYVGGKAYWYEGSVKQGTYYDPKGIIGDGSNRGREIYDPECDYWFWLDSVYDGAKAVGKEVWIPYIYQDDAAWNPDKMSDIADESDSGMESLVYYSMVYGTGKWVRYDENGHMCKGWVIIEGELAEKYPDQEGNIYYYDTRTGLMAKGWLNIDGITSYFDEVTGVFQYSVQGGDEEEYSAYSYRTGKLGKWIRYDVEGEMCKGWVTIEGELAEIFPAEEGRVYYYDTETGLMARGMTEIDGATYYFDELTGVFLYKV